MNAMMLTVTHVDGGVKKNYIDNSLGYNAPKCNCTFIPNSILHIFQ